jgi:hypothetical protein
MRRYATPTIRFHIKAKNPEDIDAVMQGTGYLTFGRYDSATNSWTQLFDAGYEVEKDNGRTYLKTTLTQEQTEMYAPNEDAYVQFRAICGKTSVVSSIEPIRVLPTLKTEVI